MAFRPDVSVLWNLSPRLIIVAAPSTEISIQDLHDTCRELEAQQENLVYPSLISSAGKENLGNGVQVGITSTLQNAKVVFDARKDFTLESQVVTGEDPNNPNLLIASDGYFVTNAVEPGSWIVNFTDGSICSAYVIIDEQTILTDGLGDGYDNTFQIGDVFEILPVIQCEVSGGNLVAVDDVGGEIDAVLPTAGTQVVRTSASSATTQNQLQLEYATFGGGVSVNQVNGFAGTSYPIGTPGVPSNNWTDAATIAEERGLIQFFLTGPTVLDTGTFKQKIFVGASPNTTILDILPAPVVSDCEFKNMTLQGVLDGSSFVRESLVLDLSYVSGFIFECALGGTLSMQNAEQASILSCYSNIPDGENTAIIDMDGYSNLVIRDYSGGIEIINSTGPSLCSVDMSSGQIILDSTVTAGDFTIRGIAKMTDNSGSNAIVDTSNLIYSEFLQLASFQGYIAIDVDNGDAGTKFPIGTHQQPVNNLPDAIRIGDSRRIDEFVLIRGSLTVDPSTPVDGYNFSSHNRTESIITFLPGCSTDRSSFSNITLRGEMNGPVYGENLVLQNVSNIGGTTFPTIFENCIFGPGINSLNSGATENIHFIRCSSGVPGDGYCELDFNGAVAPVAFRGYKGGMQISNITSGSGNTMSFDGGQLRVLASCTSGYVNVDGVVKITEDSSGPGFEVIERSSMNNESVAAAVFNTPVANHTDATTFGGWIGNKLLSVVKFLALKD